MPLTSKLKSKIASLLEKWRGAQEEIERLNKEKGGWLRERELQEAERLRWEQERERWERERERLRKENEELKRQLGEAHRANKRPAAPFSRGKRKEEPERPGRKAGKEYGQHHRKQIPSEVDEVIAVALPPQCEDPNCQGEVAVEKVETQYQHEIVRRTIWRRFDISIGHCLRCGKRSQGRHPLQTSDALGAAAVQLGPEALALGVNMNKGLGLPHADVAAVLRDGYGLEVNRSTICRAVERVAQRGEATWNGLREAARQSLFNGIDETSWRVDAQLRWLWAAVGEMVTFCDILPGRGFEQAASILGADYNGWLIHDGWAVYYKFLKAAHQSCVAHLIIRCRKMSEVATPAAALFPLQVKELLEKSLELRDRYKENKISLHGLWTATGRLEVKFDRLLARNYHDEANRRLAKHLRHERPYLFTFLYCPGLEATNNTVERVLRFLVVVRKNWGGNRTEKGARAQAVLTSILATAKQQDKNPIDLLVELLCSRDKKTVLNIVPLSQPSADSSPAPPTPEIIPPIFNSTPKTNLAHAP
jgi:transposase